ncbi:unnamed protein product [Moneuplotes crassus]|uniref:Uncharacterized protein n=1 Tax=Euplotes crassus TaxID=5936 RepID=A0AAD1X5Q5_EUPCR|nr:unnamed protein product [Moneuplotes crassus]
MISTKRKSLLSYSVVKNDKKPFNTKKNMNSFARTKCDESLCNSTQAENTSMFFTSKKLSTNHPRLSPRTLLSISSKRQPKNRLDYIRGSVQTNSSKEHLSTSRNCFMAKSSIKSYSMHGEYLVKSMKKNQNSMQSSCSKAAYKIPSSIIKSRNKKLYDKSHTFQKEPFNLEEATSEMLDVQKESKIQIPVRFRSRESLMKFGDRKPCNMTQNSINNPTTRLQKELKPIQDLRKSRQTPVKSCDKNSNEPSKLDATSVLKLLKKSLNRKLEEPFPDEALDEGSQEFLKNDIGIQYSPQGVIKAPDSSPLEIQMNSLDFSAITESQHDFQNKGTESIDIGISTSEILKLKDAAVNTNPPKTKDTQTCQHCMAPFDSDKLTALEKKVQELEVNLSQANDRISNLTIELHEEKLKNIKISCSTASDESKKIDSGSFEKLLIKPIRIPETPLKKHRSSDLSIRNRLHKIAMETIEDAEFEKLEALAVREAKMDIKSPTFSLKDKKKALHKTFMELKCQRPLLSPTLREKALPKRSLHNC